MNKCDCSNCNFKSAVGIVCPCMKDVLPLSSTGIPMPPCKSPKQEPLGEYKALKKMLEHFKERNNQRNESLADNGERKHCSPLKTIDVQELKDYMITILEKEMNL